MSEVEGAASSYLRASHRPRHILASSDAISDFPYLSNFLSLCPFLSLFSPVRGKLSDRIDRYFYESHLLWRTRCRPLSECMVVPKEYPGQSSSTAPDSTSLAQSWQLPADPPMAGTAGTGSVPAPSAGRASDDISVVQRMASATCGSVLTSVLGRLLMNACSRSSRTDCVQ